VLPPALLERSLVLVHEATVPRPADHALVTSFRTKLDKVQELDAKTRDEFVAAAVDAVATRIYPAYARMNAALEGLRGASANQAAGIGRLPDGPAYYALMLKQMTTTDYTPAEIHAMGLAEVERISAEMDALLKTQGLADGTVAARMQALAKDPHYLLANDDAGRKQALDQFQAILDDMNARMPTYFRTVPTPHLVVQRESLAAEKGAAGAHYEPAAMDGSRPGRFVVSLRDLAELPTFGMKTLAYHEGIPGHHFQIATAQNLKGVPLIRQQTLYAAYAEGWALYAERLAAEIGLYKDDPLGDLGRLQAELFRAVRLVVDTGLHAEGWSREQAIQYMVDTTGMHEAEVTSEIERYMGLPGQACAYKVGQLKILALRDKAKQALGAKFDLKAFHAVVLEDGAVPLTMLEHFVDEWIAREKAAP
jgi:uncharacterized protein (DUF885 family)